MPKLCEYLDEEGYRCPKQASYGLVSVTHCKEHKEENMKILKSGYCSCGKYSSFGLPGQKATHCAACKTDEMKGFAGNKCIECNKKRASFGFPGQKSTHCAGCKSDEMENVVGKKCAKCNRKRASYGFKGQNATHCSGCKTDEMENVVSKRCVKCNKKIASFGLPGQKPTHCAGCKTDEMENVVTKRCIKCNKSFASFGLPGKRATHCGICKTEEMLNVKSKKCIKCNETRASFGLPDQRASHCSGCKTAGMENVSNKKCLKCNKIRAGFGLPGQRASYCAGCKTSEMEDVRHKKCLSNLKGVICPQLGNKYYDGYCARCFGHTFPNHPKTQTMHTKSKELKVVSHLSKKYEGFIHDKPLYVDLEGGCCVSKRRIDLRKLIGNTILAIEIDEDQRKYHLLPQRYDDLFMDFSGKYIFIRYNPDKYRDSNGNTKNPRFETRMKHLEQEIDRHIKRINKEENKELIEIEYLYYHEDQDDPPLQDVNA